MFQRTSSLKTKLMILVTFIVILQSAVLVAILDFSDFFLKLDQQIIKNFDDIATKRLDMFNSEISSIVKNVNEASQNITDYIGNDEDSIDTLYYEQNMTNIVLSLLNENKVSSAFYTFTNPEDSNFAYSIHIEDTQPDRIHSDNVYYELFVGPSSVAQRYGIGVSTYWDIHLAFEQALYPQGTYDFYKKPIEAVELNQDLNLNSYGFWSVSRSILNEHQNFVYYTIPILGKFGDPIGVVGVSIDETYFMSTYLPSEEIGYDTGTYALVNIANNAMFVGNEVPRISAYKSFFIGSIPITPVDYAENFYEFEMTYLSDIPTELYVKLLPVSMYSNNSPFLQNNWNFAAIVPQSELKENSNTIATIFIQNVLLITFIGCAISYVIIHFTTRKIIGLSKYIKELEPNQKINFKKTNLTEIDELTTAVTLLNKRVIESSNKVEYILKMSALNIGGYELNGDTDVVILTEYIYNLLGLNVGTIVKKEKWITYYRKLTKSPVDGQEDIYSYRFRNRDSWLKIVKTYTTDGEIGMILDVTKEMLDSISVQKKLDYDELTKLYNRVAFRKVVDESIQKSPKKIGAMMFIDLDNLKYMNDTFGHECGDLLIISAANLFKRFETYGGIPSRNSGDEFTVFLHGFDSEDEVRMIIEKERKEFDKVLLQLPNGEQQKVRFSMGISWFPKDSTNSNELLKFADTAMFEAKRSAKGSTREFDKKVHDSNLFLIGTQEKIHKLVDESLIYFAYHPIVDLATGEIFGYEALMRSKLDEFKLPAEILKAAAQQSLLAKLEKVVMFTAIKEINERRDEFKGKKIFLNSIANQVLSHADVAELAKKYAHILQDIVLEITKTEDISPELMKQKVAIARECGMKVALDGFGSGYSNEMRIVTIAPDIVKIDMDLIQGISVDKDKQQVVESIIKSCHDRNAKVIADGVDSINDISTIVQLGADYIQSYYIARPSATLEPIDDTMHNKIVECYKQMSNK